MLSRPISGSSFPFRTCLVQIARPTITGTSKNKTINAKKKQKKVSLSSDKTKTPVSFPPLENIKIGQVFVLQKCCTPYEETFKASCFVCLLFVVVVVVVLSVSLLYWHRRKNTPGWQYKGRFFTLNLVVISLYLFASEGAKAFLLNVFVLISTSYVTPKQKSADWCPKPANRANSAGNKEHAGVHSYWRINFLLYYLPARWVCSKPANTLIPPPGKFVDLRLDWRWTTLVRTPSPTV